MVKKEFTYRGKTIEELAAMSLKEFAVLLPSRQRRSLNRGLSDKQKKLLKKIKADKSPETQCRDMIILPAMVSRGVKIHNGKSFTLVRIEPDMLGHYLGEFVLTRKKVMHHAPGIGATRSSASLSVK